MTSYTLLTPLILEYISKFQIFASADPEKNVKNIGKMRIGTGTLQ